MDTSTCVFILNLVKHLVDGTILHTVHIRKQYKHLALIWHPDKKRHTNSESVFKYIGQAYTYLMSLSINEVVTLTDPYTTFFIDPAILRIPTWLPCDVNESETSLDFPLRYGPSQRYGTIQRHGTSEENTRFILADVSESNATSINCRVINTMVGLELSKHPSTLLDHTFDVHPNTFIRKHDANTVQNDTPVLSTFSYLMCHNILSNKWVHTNTIICPFCSGTSSEETICLTCSGDGLLTSPDIVVYTYYIAIIIGPNINLTNGLDAVLTVGVNARTQVRVKFTCTLQKPWRLTHLDCLSDCAELELGITISYLESLLNETYTIYTSTLLGSIIVHPIGIVEDGTLERVITKTGMNVLIHFNVRRLTHLTLDERFRMLQMFDHICRSHIEIPNCVLK
jgi:hypothetical protein